MDSLNGLDTVIGRLFVAAPAVAPGIDQPVVVGGEAVDEQVFFFGQHIGAGVGFGEIAANVESEEQDGEGGKEGGIPTVTQRPAE